MKITAECFHVTGQRERGGCGWTAEGPTADRAAEQHTKATGHSTTVSTVHPRHVQPRQYAEPPAPRGEYDGP